MPRLIYGHIVSNQVKIHYYRTGDEKPALVMLHGLTDNALCWGRVALYFEVDHDVVLPDARGHGLSDAPASGYGYAQHAADVAALIEQLGLFKPVLLGHSMGAVTAATTAAAYPNLVGAVILEDPPFNAGTDGHAGGDPQAAADAWREQIVANKSRRVDELMALAQSQNPLWDEADLDQWAKAKQEVSPNVVQVITDPTEPWREVLARIVCPVLLITGDPQLGAVISPELAQQIAARYKNVSVIQIPGAGHSIHREQLRPYLSAVAGFLKRQHKRR
jgi:pimeloyl-ACP methyl ester carboxylesterase